MGTHKISFEFPSDVLVALSESENEFKQRVKIAMAVELYRMEKVTLGKAAQIAGLSRLQFETFLSENEIAISQLTFDEVMEDSKKLK